MRWRLRLLWIAALLLVALALGLTFVRLLEMPTELGYDASLFVRVNHALYPRLSYVGGAVEALAVLATVVLAVFERDTRRFLPTLSSAILTAAALALWVTVVQAANSVFATWAPQSMPPDWQRWRLQWELGQIGSLVLLSVAFILLLIALTGPADGHSRRRGVRRAPDDSSTW
ncbi:hypothetical protein [Nonomuraea sp. 10N515B]|uniref:hypothetical protein n=1 Tax=Nonomuraea sp. 10N515B TaxID=3457422 RepID=UPI003FCD4A23